jgi:hypothetical protein
MKAPNTSTIAPEIIKKAFLHTHSMQKMTEYYSKKPMGGGGNSNLPQAVLPDTLKCLPAKNSIVNK